MPQEDANKIAGEVAERMPIALATLIDTLSGGLHAEIPSLEKYVTNDRSLAYSEKLASVFSYHGSDKSSLHNYHLIYGHIFTFFGAPPKILEIGLGSNNVNIPSNMGANGAPGHPSKPLEIFHQNL